MPSELSHHTQARSFGGAWLQGISLTAWWFAVESCVEIAWGSPERGRMSMETYLASLVLCGLAASWLRSIGRTFRKPLPGNAPFNGPSLDRWWALTVAFSLIIALRGHKLLLGRVNEIGAFFGAGAFGISVIAIGLLVPHLVARIKAGGGARNRLLVAWTCIGFVSGIAFLKLEFHCAVLTDTPRARGVQLFLAAGTAIALLAALPWASKIRRPLPLPRGAPRWVAALAFACGVQLLQHRMADAQLDRAPVSSSEGPSALLIIVDTLRADRLTNYGYPHPTSPHIAEFASNAVQFERTASSAPWTLPAIASILTARDTGHHGAGFNSGEENLLTPLPAEIPTITEIAGGAGIVTVGLGTNPYLRRLFGLSRGFDVYECPLGESRAKMPVELLSPLLGIELAPYTVAEDMVDRALAWIAPRRDQQFLMMLHLMDPHTPYRSKPSPWTQAAPLGANEDVPDPALYDGEIERVDRALGQLFAGLEELGIADDMTIVVTADHGEVLGDRGHENWEEGDDEWFRPFDHGQHMYEELLRVPLVIKPPANAHAKARKIHELFPMVDLAPTLLEFMGVASDALGGQGVSWAPVLRGSSPPSTRIGFSRSTLYGPEAMALSDGAHKLIVRRTPEGSERHMIYDLLADPNESNPNATVTDSVRSHLEMTLEAIAASGTAGQGMDAFELSPGMQEHLRSLGYVN